MVRNLGCIEFIEDEQRFVYHSERNPYLEPKVISTTVLFGLVKKDPWKNNTFATKEFADLLARGFINGRVVEITRHGTMFTDVPQRWIVYDTPDGPFSFLAGLVADALGDDVNCANWLTKNAEIAKVMGVPKIPGMAEAIYDFAAKEIPRKE